MPKLYIVATPIGNLKDISARALDVLATCDEILAEDTRQTRKLLAHYQIYTPLESFHDHSPEVRMERIFAKLESGKNLALVSDSGTPLLSDPGFPLIRRAVEKGITVEPVPGPSAMLAALVASGAPMDRFTFEGFPAPKGSRRKARLEAIKNETRTQVLYESPYHVVKLLNDLKTVLGGDRNIVIAREMTKIHEEFLRGTVDELLAHFEKTEPRGEFVIIIPKA